MWPKGDSSTVTPTVRGAGHWGHGRRAVSGRHRCRTPRRLAAVFGGLRGCHSGRVVGTEGAFCLLQVVFSEAPRRGDARWVPHTPGHCDPGKVSGLGAPEGFRRH